MHVAIGLYAISAILHMFGLYILKRFKPKRTSLSTQRLCLMNLCFAGFVLSIAGIAIRVLLLLRNPYSSHVLIWQTGFVNCWYMSITILLTFDRFLAVHLNIRYHLYWSTKKMCVGLFTVFIISVSISTVMMIIPVPMKTKFQLISAYVWPVYDILSLFFIMLTYIYLYYKIRENRKKELKLKKELNSNNDNNFKELQKSFYLPTLIILSFLCFYVIPDMVFSIAMWMKKTLPQELKTSLVMMYPIGVIIDAILCIAFPAKMYGDSSSKRSGYHCC